MLFIVTSLHSFLTLTFIVTFPKVKQLSKIRQNFAYTFGPLVCCFWKFVLVSVSKSFFLFYFPGLIRRRKWGYVSRYCCDQEICCFAESEFFLSVSWTFHCSIYILHFFVLKNNGMRVWNIAKLVYICKSVRLIDLSSNINQFGFIGAACYTEIFCNTSEHVKVIVTC